MKIVLKGILTHEDAALAADNGIDAIIVSNHGGRVADSGRAKIEILPEIIEAVGGRIPVLVDSGFRRGTDIIKALAMGAQAVCIGRPYCGASAPSVSRVSNGFSKSSATKLARSCSRWGLGQSSISPDHGAASLSPGHLLRPICFQNRPRIPMEASWRP